MPDLDVIIAKHELAKLLEANASQSKHITDLQTRMTEMQEAQLSRRVRAFHLKFGHPVHTTPRVPDDGTVRFRLSLIAEEFIELLEASFQHTQMDHFKIVRHAIRVLIESQSVSVDLPEFYDALLDLAYVIEGSHAVCGTNADPGIAEIQRANMAKDPVYVASKDAHHREPDPKAKPTKPADWTPPDQRRVLLAQGWRPTLCDLAAHVEEGDCEGSAT